MSLVVLSTVTPIRGMLQIVATDMTVRTIIVPQRLTQNISTLGGNRFHVRLP